jgi:DNA ligase-1
MLFEGPEDLRPLGFRIRRARLEAWFERERPPGMALSDLVPFAGAGTGLMLKHPDSPYVAARGHGFWVKRRRPPRLVSAQLLYAEEGRYTVGLWQDGVLVPVGQATAPGADSLDRWVREHTIARYGPVREVDKTLVVSVAFTSVRPAPRRKAGVVLQGARIVGLLGDARADRLDALVARD